LVYFGGIQGWRGKGGGFVGDLEVGEEVEVLGHG